MTSSGKPPVADVFSRWKTEDRQLFTLIGELRHWMSEVAQLGIPHFGETATRLRPLRETLVQHFANEDEMIDQLTSQMSSAQITDQITDLYGRSSPGHQQLRDKLDGLIDRLNDLEPPFDSWQSAMAEVGEFFDDLEQHEKQESESVAGLIAAA